MCNPDAPPSTVPAIAPATALEAEADDHHDTDSALGDSIASSTTSIGSSILKYREENGRTYHAYKDGKYFFPNDENENDRLDLQHHIYSLTYDGKLLSAPIPKEKQIHHVLDVGTGTGIWAIDYGDEHPEAKVLGIDLSAIQPTFLPPNVTFEIDDADEPWTYSQKFDFIHARMMTGSIASWPNFFGQCFEFTNPGGWLELSDVIFPVGCDDGTMGPQTALHKWSTVIFDASLKMDRPLNSAKTYKKLMEEAGYVDVVEKIDRWPTNKWPKDPKYKELGLWTNENLVSGLSGLSMALLTRIQNWSSEAVELFLVDVRKDLNNTRIHAYLPIYTIYGRKPE
ncbi:S-adenosyl-L-methionine-dependent methyltransferase [Halenospora varia]|nr:S-adenosyl-L-methionine-dependent methyltransferase [Halenospora varia]